MGRNHTEWVDAKKTIIHLIKEYGHPNSDSEDENGKYHAVYVRWSDGKRFKDITPRNCDPYNMLFIEE